MTPLSLDQLARWQIRRIAPTRWLWYARNRMPRLLTERHRSMTLSALAFVCGIQAMMARDLGMAEHRGLELSLCGVDHTSLRL